MPDCESDHDFSGHFCVNPKCPLYGRKAEGNIRLKGHGGKGRRIHELYCVQCGKAFSENQGTAFYRGHLPRERVLDIVRHLLEGCGVRGTGRLLGHHRGTVIRCLAQVAPHVLAVLNNLLVDLRCPEIQMDEFWAFVRKKEKRATTAEKLQEGYGDRWIHLAMDAVSRLIVAWTVDRRTKKATDDLVSSVASRLEEPQDALYTSDQHEPYEPAIARLIEAADQFAPEHQLEPAAEASSPDRPGPVYATVKKTYKQGRCVKVERELVLGTPEDLQQRLEESPVSSKVNTSFIERLNNTFRQDGRRVARKTLGFSKDPDLLEAQVILQIGHYNLVRPHASLTVTETRDDGKKRKKVLRTPAMAAGVTSSRWSLLDLLTYKVSPLEAAPGATARAA